MEGEKGRAGHTLFCRTIALFRLHFFVKRTKDVNSGLLMPQQLLRSLMAALTSLMCCRLPKWMLKKGLPGIPPAERGYRAFWWRKGDVFRLLMSLQNVLDGCTWPRQDERAVQQLQGFIHHVTGECPSMSALGQPCLRTSVVAPGSLTQICLRPVAA